MQHNQKIYSKANEKSSTIEIPFTANTRQDFIKRFHIETQDSSIDFSRSKMLMIYENQFKIRYSCPGSSDMVSRNSQQQKMEVELPVYGEVKQQSTLNEIQCQTDACQYRDIHFETVPYDAAFINTSSNDYAANIIASNRTMPVRIYQIPSQHLSQNPNTSPTYCTFNDHKLNSQAFLSPFEFSVKNQKVVGVGRKFFNIYDCEKIKVTRLKAFDKLHLSTVHLLSDQCTALVGDFVGNIYPIDLRQQNSKLNENKFKPHVDAIFHLKSFSHNQNMFLSSGRKDNFTYLFDRRNLSTFVKYLQFDRNSNQRYGLSVYEDKFAIGTEQGSIYMGDLRSLEEGSVDEGNMVVKDGLEVNVADLSLVKLSERQVGVVYSLGTRFFPQDQEGVQNQVESRSFGLSLFKHQISK